MTKEEADLLDRYEEVRSVNLLESELTDLAQDDLIRHALHSYQQGSAPRAKGCKVSRLRVATKADRSS